MKLWAAKSLRKRCIECVGASTMKRRGVARFEDKVRPSQTRNFHLPVAFE
jgi:hypothetical protein